MSSSQNGRYMDRPTGQAGSVRRARELAETGRRDPNSIPVPQFPRAMEVNQPVAQGVPRRAVPQPNTVNSRIPRPQAPPGLQTKDGQLSMPISRPTQVPQWPLAGPLASPPPQADNEPYRPPPGRSQPPQRPPRPSRVPSMLDASKVQEHTPVFQYTPQTGRESGADMSSVPATPSTAISRGSTQSSVGSIPDFPMPIQAPAGTAPRRSVGLGPPPSSRRGASSFYSNASYVSPIPEESPRIRSNANSYASSAAMPQSLGSPGLPRSPDSPDNFYDDAIPEEGSQSVLSDDGDESRLVRSASLLKRGKASLVTTSNPRAVEMDEDPQRPGISPMQGGSAQDGMSFLDGSSSSSGTPPTVKNGVGGALTADTILNAYNAASAVDLSNPVPSPQPPSRPYSRLSAIRRPPRLDIDAVKKAEARGSLTSLPDLIRRATRLAASLERGRRPASRFGSLEDFLDAAKDGEKDMPVDLEKHQSGLSDMLAAFPPPAQAANRRNVRQSFRQQVGSSWPLPVNFARGSTQEPVPMIQLPKRPTKEPRTCFGLPLKGFVFVITVIALLVAAAIIVPLEFFVFHKQDFQGDVTAQPALSQCQNQLTCENGGTNVVNNGTCSCICTNGFTGFDCIVPGSTGCTTSSFSGDNLDNATLGDSIPRLILQAETNFSIPLSATDILSKLNSGNLSCIAENALVTFDGESSRQGDASAEVTDTSSAANALNAVAPTVANGVAVVTVTIVEGSGTTRTLVATQTSPLVSPPASATDKNVANYGAGTTTSAPSSSTSPDFIATTSISPTTTTTVTTTISTVPSAASASATFTVTEEVLDFARVAVLFILQQEDLGSAETAQDDLQRFFTSASEGSQRKGTGVTVDQARNVTVGGDNSVDLVQFVVQAGTGRVGSETR